MLYNKDAGLYGDAACPEMTMPQAYDLHDRDCGCGCGGGCDPGCGCQVECPTSAVYDPPVERVVRRNFLHPVQHIQQINTRVINNHVFQHAYCPRYTCCEECHVMTIDPGCGCHQY